MMSNQIQSSQEQQPNTQLPDVNYVYHQAQEVAKILEPDFKMDENFTPVMRLLALYFANDLRFEEEGRKLNKGILLVGNIGTGKTLLMNVFKRNYRLGFKLISTNTINEDYQIDGIPGIRDYFLKRTEYSAGGFCFDDLGAESFPVKHMGTEVRPMEKIILHRYENSIPFHWTHFTSNLDGNQIEELYGTRVRSRLREMCNFIVMNGTDRRI